MIRQIAITLAFTATIAGSAAALAQEQAAPTEAQKTEPSAAPAAPLWLMSCSNQQQPEQLLCEFSQSIVLSQGNQTQRVATASFSRVAGQSETSATFSLPYGVSLPDPVNIMVDDKQVGTAAWQSCDMGGCYARAQVDKSWLQAMRNGNKMTAGLKARDGRDLTFSFQLDGFTKAEAMLP